MRGSLRESRGARDSGVGRAAAIAYAREGLDVAINYYPDEEPDGQQLSGDEALHKRRSC